MAEGKEKERTHWGGWLAVFLAVVAVATYITGRNKDPSGTLALLAGTCLVVLGIALYQSFRIGKTQTEVDNEVHPSVKRRPFLLNPVILTYFAFFVVLIVLIAYFGAVF